MANATAICTCRKCGNTFQKIKKCYNRAEADSWEAWAQKNYDLCDSCYAAEQREAEIKKGLYVDIRLNIGGNIADDAQDRSIAFVFGGDTKPHKDEIKALGAIWSNDYPADNGIKDAFLMRSMAFKWSLYCSEDSYKSTLQKVKDLGAKINSFPSGNDIAFFNSIKQRHDAARAKLQAELDKIGPIPSWPEEIKKLWPDGAKWNGKFYGRPGNWSIYLSGEKIILTDDLKQAFEDTYKARTEWRAKKEKIEKDILK